MKAGPLPLATGPWAAALAASAPFTYRRSVVPSKVPTRCVHVFSGSVGPFTGRSAPLAVRTRNFATPASRKSMYWLFAQPLTLFSKMPPFCPAKVGRPQASTDTAFLSARRSFVVERELIGEGVADIGGLW